MLREYKAEDIKDIENIGKRIKDGYRLVLNEFSHVLVFDDSGIKGFLIYLDLSTEIELIDVAVEKEKERQGIGTRLLNELFTIAKAKGVKLISLEVREDNLNAIAFYERNSFVKSHLRKDYYEDSCNAIVMIKEL